MECTEASLLVYQMFETAHVRVNLEREEIGKWLHPCEFLKTGLKRYMVEMGTVADWDDADWDYLNIPRKNIRYVLQWDAVDSVVVICTLSVGLQA